MKGWKTWLAAILMIAWGVGGWVAGIHTPDIAIGFVTAGLAAIGIGHKIDRIVP